MRDGQADARALRRRPRRHGPAPAEAGGGARARGGGPGGGCVPKRVGGGFGIALRVAGAVIRARTGLEPQAPISGQRALQPEVARAVVPFAPGFGMETAMTIDAHRAGFRLVEVELAARAPRHRSHARRLPPPRPSAVRVSARIRFPPVILAIDQGTTGTTCIVFDERGGHRGPRVPRVRAALPAAGLGRARRGGDLGRHARGGRGGARRGGHRATRPRRDRHHQPARDGRGVGPSQRRAAPPTRSSGRTAAPPPAATS